jgi:AraC-like DNA-binding protein
LRRSSKLPTLLYGRVGSEEIAFQLAKEGADYFIPEGKTDELLATLNELKERITFRIDLRDFGFDLDRTSYWTRKYLDFIVEDNNYLKYSSVGEIAQQLKISISTIEHALKKDGLFSPKLLLLSLKNYHAAYFSQTTEWTTKIIAERCGFANERELYRSFANKTGVTLRRFCESKDWREFPALCVRRHHKS